MYPLLAQLLGKVVAPISGQAGKARLPHLQFKDRLRRWPSQKLPLLHCSSTGSLLRVGPSTKTDPSVSEDGPQGTQAPPLVITERKGRDPTKHLQSHMGFSFPEGNFEGNQLPGDSMSLSPLRQTPTNELHVSIKTSFHRSFPRLHCDLA